jgi:hypothetical protein
MKGADLENIIIYVSIVLCTAAVAYWLHSPQGLWSMLMLLFVKYDA